MSIIKKLAFIFALASLALVLAPAPKVMAASTGNLEINAFGLNFGIVNASQKLKIWYDNGTPYNYNGNATSIYGVTTGTHTIKVSVPQGFSVMGVATCVQPNCSGSSLVDGPGIYKLSNYKTDGLSCDSASATCSYTVSVAEGGPTEVAFMYTSPIVDHKIIIERVDENSNLVSFPTTVSNYYQSAGSLAYQTENPYTTVQTRSCGGEGSVFGCTFQLNEYAISDPGPNYTVTASVCGSSDGVNCNSATNDPSSSLGEINTYEHHFGPLSFTHVIGGMSFSDPSIMLPPTAKTWIVKFIYHSTGVGNVEVKRVGATTNDADSAPAGTSAQVDAQTQIAANPAIFNSISSGTHTAKVTNVSGYSVDAGTCEYNPKDNPKYVPICSTLVSSGTSFKNPVMVTCAGSTCSAPISVDTDRTTRIAFRYKVATPNVPTATLIANPASVITGSTSTLTWNSTNSTSCVGTGFSTGNAVSGSVSTGNLTSNQNYSVSCTGAGGTATANASVVVTAPPAGSLEVKRVGTDFLTSSIPSTSAWYDSVAPVATNSFTFADVLVGSHTANVSVPAGYNVTGVATCNTPGCSLSNLSSYTTVGLTCTSNACSYTPASGVTANNLTRVVFMYAPNTGSLEVKRVGVDFTTSSIPATTAWYDSVASVADNSFIFNNVQAGSHTVSVSVPAGYNVSGVATCNTAGCGLASLSDYTSTGLACAANACSYTPASGVTVSNLTRVVFMYALIVSKTLTGVLSAVPASGAAPLSVALTANAGGTLLARSSSATAAAANALAINDVPITYTFTCGNSSAANPPSVTTASVSAQSTCNYPAAGTYNPSVVITAGGLSATDSKTITVTAAPPAGGGNGGGNGGGTGGTGGTGSISACQAQNSSGQTINQQYVGSPVVWKYVGAGASANSTYTWMDALTGARLASGVGLTSFTKIYTTTGNKSVSVIVDLNPASVCSVGSAAAPATLLKIIVNPGFIEF